MFKLDFFILNPKKISTRKSMKKFKKQNKLK